MSHAEQIMTALARRETGITKDGAQISPGEKPFVLCGGFFARESAGCHPLVNVSADDGRRGENENSVRCNHATNGFEQGKVLAEFDVLDKPGHHDHVERAFRERIDANSY